MWWWWVVLKFKKLLLMAGAGSRRELPREMCEPNGPLELYRGYPEVK